MSVKIGGWLARLSDPQGLNSNWSSEPFLQSEAALLEALVDAAGRHNVRPALVANLQVQLDTAPDLLLSAPVQWQRDVGEKVLSYANHLQMLDIGRAMLLASVAEEILENTSNQDIPVVLVKGADFAENAYGGLQARTFSDIDLLVKSDAERALEVVLRKLEFKLADIPAKRVDHPERQWTRPDKFGGWTAVDVHTDMVHAPELRSAQTLTYELYADPSAGGVSPASRLILAGLHGATSHLFGRLQYVVDGLSIARTGVDAIELRDRAQRSGATLPVATMLRLAAEIYNCEACRMLLNELGPIPWSNLERSLISGPMVLSAKSRHRWRLRPQRALYRLLLQRSDRQRHGIP
jgi:hypothetical protein